MFPSSYFNNQYYAGRYFPHRAEDIISTRISLAGSYQSEIIIAGSYDFEITLAGSYQTDITVAGSQE